MLRAAAYIRVSTAEQTELSPDAQKRLILEFAKRNDILVLPEHIYIDAGISGRNANKRPEFIRMISNAKSTPKLFDVILVHEFSRFARNRTDSIVYKSMLLKNNGIKVISTTESTLNADDKMSILMEAIIEAMDEYYSINLSEEVKKGMTEKALRGEATGVAPWGYINHNRTYIIDEQKAAYIRKGAEDFLLHNKSFFKIAQEWNALGLRTSRGNKFDTRAVKYIYSNPAYTGYIVYGKTSKMRGTTAIEQPKEDWITVQGKHPAILSENIYQEIQDKIAYNNKIYHSTTAPKSPKTIHYLSGLVKCNYCGASYSIQVSRYHSKANPDILYEHTYFKCSKYLHSKCDNKKGLRSELLESIFLQALDEIAAHSSIEYRKLQAPIHTNHPEIDIFENQIKRINQMLNRAKQSYLEGIESIEEYKETKLSLIGEKAFYENKLEEIRSSSLPNTVPFLEETRNLLEIIQSEAIPNYQKNEILKTIIQKIDYTIETQCMDIYFIAGYSDIG